MDEPQDQKAENQTATADATEDATPAESTNSEENPGGFDIESFEATRSVAARQAERLGELKNEMKLVSEQLKSLLENDPALVHAQEAAKEVTEKVKVRRTEIMETPEAKKLKLKLGDIKEEKGEMEESLSSLLFDLYQSTGVMEFEDFNGDVWEYDIKAKLKTKKTV